MIKKILLSNFLFFFTTGFIYADYIRISQIDPSSLLLNQQIKLYVSVTDENGDPVSGLSREAFSVFESADNRKNFIKIDNITGFEDMVNYETGINFLLLVDNSGSMYRTLSGSRARRASDMRISHAKKALITFLKSVTNPKDNIGLAAYNSYYTTYSDLTNDRVKIQGYIDKIKRPGKYEAYSEIYSSVYLAVDEFSSVKGRKAIIVLSDGQNQSFYKYTKKMHKTFGDKIFDYSEPVKYCQEEGISVYAINFGPMGARKDKGLTKIAYQTGGTVFDARNQKQLSEVYNKIVNQILNEYYITYNATMQPADKKYVKVNYNSSKGPIASTRFYFSSTVFGLPVSNFNVLLIVPFLLALGLLWLLSRIKFEKQKSDPSLEILNPGSAKASTNFFTLDKNKNTIIGGDPSADMTISGGTTRIREKHATVSFNNTQKKYKITANGNLTVNNKPVKTKILEPGDVINVGGTTIVFDDGEVE